MAHKVRFGLTFSNRGVLLGLTTSDELLEAAEMAEDAGVFININDDREAAIQESQRFLEEYYTPIKVPRARVEGWVACGSPQQCIRQLQTFVEAGATDILLRFPSWDQKTQFKRCVEAVLPHFA